MTVENAYLIKGGRLLKGRLKVSGAKNSAMKAAIASLLFSKPSELVNIPAIMDMKEVFHIIESLGGKVDWDYKSGRVTIDPSGVKENKVDLLHGAKVRVSFMFLAPLLKLFGECYIPNPGGCRIGARPIDRIIQGVEALGGEVEYDSSTGYYNMKLEKPPKGYFNFSKPSHTGTETLILLGSFTNDKVVIDNAAQEPEVDELIDLLNQAGARIFREGKKIVILKGRKDLVLDKPFSIGGDRNEAVTFAVLGLVLGDPIEVGGVNWQKYEAFLEKVREAGGEYKIFGEDSVLFFRSQNLRPVSIQTAPHPGFMTDWQPLWAILATQAEGETFITERVFENRFGYVGELRKLGAKIEFLKTMVDDSVKYFFFNAKRGEEYYQTIAVKGKVKLHEGILKISDLRAGATLAIAALIASGQSVVEGVDIVERGYENFDEKIRSLGGEIKKI